MFQLWWTPPFKGDFIKFWVSLTKQLPSPQRGSGTSTAAVAGAAGAAVSKRKKKTGATDLDSSADANNPALANKPSYDIVEEYVKSLDVYRNDKHPSDEEVANIIIKIADFLLEFASLGHEKAADVPHLVHPKIPSEDLAGIGVPHLVVDEDGRSSLVFPSIFKAVEDLSSFHVSDDGPGFESAPTKATDDLPLCTTYFFDRWMWIQFPYIALGNCDNRYGEGIKTNQEAADSLGRPKKGGGGGDPDARSQTSSSKKRPTGKELLVAKEMSKSWSVDTFKLPELKFNRKAARTLRRICAFDMADESKVAQDKFMARLVALQDEIQNYREEYDFVCQMRGSLVRRVAELSGTLEELKRSSEAVSIFDKQLETAIKNEAEATAKAESVVTMRKNLGDLLLMCERHPANVPPLIEEVEFKIEQDKYLLAEIKKRLWEQRFEKQSHMSKFRQMKKIVKEGVNMHSKLLEYRYMMKRKLARQAAEDLDLKEGRMHSKTKSAARLKSLREAADKVAASENQLLLTQGENWADIWVIISSRTGITEPEIFFQRLNNG